MWEGVSWCGRVAGTMEITHKIVHVRYFRLRI